MSPIEFIGRIADHIERARHEPGVGELAEYANGVVVQYQVNPQQLGADGLHIMAVEILSRGRLKRRQRSRMAEEGWESPRRGARSGWWRLVGSRAEAQLVAGGMLALLPEIYHVPIREVMAWSPPGTTVALQAQQPAEGPLHPASPALPSEPDASTLRRAVSRWNGLARQRGLPLCNPEVEEGEGVLYSIFPEELIVGTNAGADFVVADERLLIRLSIGNEGSPPIPAVREGLESLLPEGMRLEILRGGTVGHLYLFLDVTDLGDDDALANAWSKCVRAATVLWASTYPWDDYLIPDADALGFSEQDFSDDGCEHPLGSLICAAAVYMARFAEKADPDGGYVSREYAEGEEATHLELARAFATGYGTGELVDVYGRWIGGEVSSWSRMCCVGRPMYVAEGLDWEYYSDRPGWLLRAYTLSEDQTRRLGQLGWQETSQGEFEIPKGPGSVEDGRLVARTVVDVLGADLREDIPRWFNLGGWEGARRALSDYIEVN